jgi:hypothetical protein
VPAGKVAGLWEAMSMASSTDQMCAGSATTAAWTSSVTHSGMPLVCPSSMRSVMRSAPAIRSVTVAGNMAGSVWSSDSVPSSTCCKVTVARKVLSTLPARIWWRASMGVPDEISASPALPDQAAWSGSR